MSHRTEYLPVVALPPAPRNPKEHDEAGIRRSLARFGFTEPVLLDERTGRLVAGHGRTKVLLDMEADTQAEPPAGVLLDEEGRWTVPVVRGWASRSDAEAEAYLVAANKLAENGGWNDRGLVELLDELADLDPDLLLSTGYDPDGLEELLKSTDLLGNRATNFLDTWPDDDEDSEPGGDSEPGDQQNTGGDPDDDEPDGDGPASDTVSVSWVVSPGDRTTIRAALHHAQQRWQLPNTPAALVAVCKHYLEQPTP